MTISIESMCADARASIAALVKFRCEAAARATVEDFSAARRRLKLPQIVLNVEREVRLPVAYRCPECAGPIGAEINEWTVVDGRPTEGGVIVFCATESEETMRLLAENSPDLPTWDHYYAPDEWNGITAAASAWVRANVRIAQ